MNIGKTIVYASMCRNYGLCVILIQKINFSLDFSNMCIEIQNLLAPGWLEHTGTVKIFITHISPVSNAAGSCNSMQESVSWRIEGCGAAEGVRLISLLPQNHWGPAC